jgi:nitrile hydratase beta subunit
MNGAQDMGGVMGFGPVMPEANEPVFHAKWEKCVFGIVLAMGRPGGWTIDEGRFARENVPPLDYLSRTYYEIWLAGLKRLLLERGFVSPDELQAGHALHPAKSVASILQPENVAPMLAKGSSYERPVATPARFAVGDRVRARNMHPTGHTRLPRYVRGHAGTVTHVHGAHVFPDSNAAGQGEAPQWLYTVRFTGRELWGEAADPTVSVSVDAWESYMEPAT